MARKRRSNSRNPRKVAGGNILRTRSTGTILGETQGKRDAQSAVSGAKPILAKKPRVQASAYIKPDEVREGWSEVQYDARGRIHMVVYKREG